METYSFIDIYDTKGVEYIFVIFYLLVLIGFWKLSSKPIRVRAAIQKAIGVLTEQILRIPQGLFYSKNHTWTFLQESGVANVGLDDFIRHITGEVHFVNHKEAGETIKKGEILTEIEHQGKKLNIISPISGEILVTNMVDNETSVPSSESSLTEDWLCQIKPSDWVAETGSYFMAEAASAWAKRELQRFKDFISVSVQKHSPQTSMIALQDGGELRENTLSDLPDEVWMDFQENFLNNT